jgi:hypothetical protein
VAGQQHPWAERDELAASDLLSGERVLRDQGSGTRSAFEAALLRLGVDPAQLRMVMEML